jgi:hypothetical protein
VAHREGGPHPAVLEQLVACRRSPDGGQRGCQDPVEEVGSLRAGDFELGGR